MEQRLEHVSPTRDRVTACLVPSNLSRNLTPLARLYLDQPVGAGFSHGELTVGTSRQAAEGVWQVRIHPLG